ncbi:MAG TPA: hypothetical protein VFB12_04665 [Ktedonobacteraceae bacterium]|nr:hypothetical protein [Ktedonobacteraceae bacterium]
MSAVTYMTHKSEKIVPDVQKMLSKDLNIAALPPCQVLSPESLGVPYVETLLPTIQIVRGKPPLFFLYFSLTSPRSFELQAFMTHAKLATTVHRLIYAVPLVKPVHGPVTLGEQKMFTTSVFEGDSETAARLNSHSDLLKRANKLAVTSVSYGNVTLTISRYLTIQPQPTGSLLLLHTLPRLLMLRWTLAAGDVMELASLIEASL